MRCDRIAPSATKCLRRFIGRPAIPASQPPDEARIRENKTAFEERFLSNKRKLVFFEWLRNRQSEARVMTAVACES